MTYLPKNPIQKAQMMLDLISTRQEAIGSNIANMDTPNYVRKDIDFTQYINTMNGSLETALSQKLGPSGVMEARGGENFSVEDELAIAQKNSILYSVAVKQMSSAIKQMKTVMNVGS